MVYENITGLLYENKVQRSPIYSLVVLRALSKVTNKLYIPFILPFCNNSDLSDITSQ